MANLPAVIENFLAELYVTWLIFCQIHGDMTEMYKFITGKNDLNCKLKLNFHSTLASGYDTRGNVYKLIPIYWKYEFKNITLLIDME